MERATTGGCTRPRGVRAARCGLLVGKGGWRDGRAGWRGTYSRLAMISLVDAHPFRPFEHGSLKQMKAGTSVTFFATP